MEFLLLQMSPVVQGERNQNTLPPLSVTSSILLKERRAFLPRIITFLVINKLEAERVYNFYFTKNFVTTRISLKIAVKTNQFFFSKRRIFSKTATVF